MATERVKALRKNPCIQGVLDAVENSLTGAQKKEILNDLGDRIDAEKATNNLSDSESVGNVMAKLFQENADNKTIQTANALRAAFLHDEKLGVVDKLFPKQEDYNLGLQAQTGAIISNRPGARELSTKLHQKTLYNDRFGRMMLNLDKNGVMNDVKLKLHQEDVAKELWEKASSKNERAELIADSMRPIYNETILGLNKVGIPVKSLKGFVASMHRDPERMLHTHDTLWERAKWTLAHPFNHEERYELAFNRWKNKEFQWLNMNETFKNGMIDEDLFMRASFDNLTTYDPIKQSADLEDLRTFGGLGESGSRGRQLIYKGGSEFFAANHEFGYGDLYDTINKTIEKGAHMEALAKDWSTSPYKLWGALTNTLKRRVHGAGKDGIVKKINAQKLVFDEMTGRAAIPVSNMSNNISNVITFSQIMSKLGSSIFPAIGDLNYMASSLRHNFDKNYFSSHAYSFQNYISHVRLNSTAKDLANMGEWQTNITGQFASRFTTLDGPVGMIAKGVQQMMKWNGIHWQDNMLSRGLTTLNGRFLWEAASKDFEHLNPKIRAFLERYSITDKEWDVMRKNPNVAKDGRKYITPDDAVLNYSKGDIKTMLGKSDITKSEYDDARSGIRQKLIALLSDESSFVYLEPDIVERSKLRFGSHPGTLAGNAMKFFVQFHTWPFAQTRRVLGRALTDIREAPGFLPKAALTLKSMPQIASIIAGFMVTGYAADTFSNWSRGLEKPDPTKLATWAKASLGAYGIVGDVLSMLFGQQNFGNSPLLNLAGPVYGEGDKAAKFLNDVFTGKFKSAGRLGFELVKGNALPTNLFYTRWALNHLIMYGLEEKLFPGSIEKMVRRARQNKEPPYIFSSPLSALGV